MHAALVWVNIDPEAQESALTMLREEIVPMVSSASGFVAGYWLEPENSKGFAMILFETEAQARETTQPVGPAPVPGVTIERVEFRAVTASA